MPPRFRGKRFGNTSVFRAAGSMSTSELWAAGISRRRWPGLATAHAQDASSFAMVLTQSDPALIAAPLQKLGLTKTDYFIGQVPPREVPRYLKAADVAVSFIKPCFSKLSSSPTKIAEY